jgi:hypothetical protein
MVRTHLHTELTEKAGSNLIFTGEFPKGSGTDGTGILRSWDEKQKWTRLEIDSLCS